jgi:glycine oxidase
MNPGRVIVVGGGVIGLSIAWELARRGASVRLIERDRVGQATSWSAGGILPPARQAGATDPLDQLRGLSHDLYPSWTQALQTATGIDPGFRRCGAWYLADTPGERAAMIGMTDYWHELGIDCQSVSNTELTIREPALRSWARERNELAAWWVPDECQIRSPDYLSALAAACRSTGVEISEGLSVCDLHHRSSSVSLDARPTSAESNSNEQLQSFAADYAVVCAGAWSGQIAESLRLEQALVPVRGQMLLLKSECPLFRPIINVGHRYLVPRDDGHLLVGSCEEEVGFVPGTTDQMIDSLRSFATALCPELKLAKEVRTWSGLRPMTFDGFPMIGRVPTTTNVFVAAGHFRSGIHLSPATAVVLADLICGDQPAVSLDAFRIGKQQQSINATAERT